MATDNQKTTRRRGKALEDAVLTAAWALVNDVGYERLTMAGVAAKAQATKPVLYRRWPDKASLVTSAFLKFGPKINRNLAVPNTGSLREDLLGFFGQLVVVFNALGTEKLQGLVADRLKQVPIEKLFGLTMGNPIIEPKLKVILQQAQQRGELSVDAQSPRTLSLPVILIINEVLSQGTLTQASLAAMVDEILVPVFRGQQ